MFRCVNIEFPLLLLTASSLSCLRTHTAVARAVVIVMAVVFPVRSFVGSFNPVQLSHKQSISVHSYTFSHRRSIDQRKDLILEKVVSIPRKREAGGGAGSGDEYSS